MDVTILSRDNKTLGKGTKRLFVTFDNTDVSIVNALRRVITTNIQTLVFRGFPYKDNQINILKNTTKFNNEYLKHRLACIPIMNDDESTFSAFCNLYKIEVNVTNDSLEKKYVTTEDFNIIDKQTNKPIKEDKTKYFPPDPITGDYLLFCILYPNQNSQEENETIHFEANIDKGTASESSCWNVAHHCVYENVIDSAIVSEKLNQIEGKKEKMDFQLLDAQRHFIKDRFIFSVETIGIYTNEALIIKACKYILNRISELNTYFTKTPTIIQTKSEYNELVNDGTMNQEDRTYYQRMYCAMYKEDSFIILEIKEDDFTIGKIIENHFYKKYKDIISFVGFKKEHPTKKEAYIYIKYNNDIDDTMVYKHFIDLLQGLNSIFTKIQSEFMTNN